MLLYSSLIPLPEDKFLLQLKAPWDSMPDLQLLSRVFCGFWVISARPMGLCQMPYSTRNGTRHLISGNWIQSHIWWRFVEKVLRYYSLSSCFIPTKLGCFFTGTEAATSQNIGLALEQYLTVSKLKLKNGRVLGPQRKREIH